MQYIILISALLLTGCATKYAFEKEKYQQGLICKEMVGTWYTDITINTNPSDIIRYITKLTRNSDGSAYLKGVNLYLSTNKSETWSFPSTWSCNQKWYTEKNEWGYTSFKIIKLGEKKHILKDELANLSPEKVEFIEYQVYKALNSAINNYLNN